MSETIKWKSLKTGDVITVKFHSRFGSTTENVIYLSRQGEGDNAEISLWSIGRNGEMGYSFEIYRYKNHWAYGSSADRISLLGVVSKEWAYGPNAISKAQ